MCFCVLFVLFWWALIVDVFCSLGHLGIHIYKTVSQGPFRQFVLCSMYFSQYFSFVFLFIRPLHCILDLILFTSLRFLSLFCNDFYFISAFHNSYHIQHSRVWYNPTFTHYVFAYIPLHLSPLLRFRLHT